MVMAVTDEAVDWAGGLDELVEQIARRFRRIEPRRRVRAYLQGLLAPVERKNGWQLAENAGDRTPDGVQDFLAGMRWDAGQARDDPGLRRGRLCGRMPLRNWAMPRRCWSWTRLGLSRKGTSRSGCSGSIRARPAHRELPDRGVSRLCQPARSRADRPRPVSARGLGQYPDPEGRGRNAGGYGFRHQTTARA